MYPCFIFLKARPALKVNQIVFLQLKVQPIAYVGEEKKITICNIISDPNRLLEFTSEEAIRALKVWGQGGN